jgi:acetoin utilization deacetylase AcuC-like enzyme
MYDPIFLSHDPGPMHPESPLRLKAVLEAIDSVQADKVTIPAHPATRDELLLVHEKDYVERILELKVTETIQLDLDTSISEHSVEAALKAAGGTIEATRQVIDGGLRKAFCAVRPPGHHAEYDRSMGFCIFNNIAIGAAYALKKGVERIAIVDWDLHHGNGTQSAFYNTDKVLYISMHQSPYFPGTGFESEKGAGKGLGFTINIPFMAYSGDSDFRAAFDNTLVPALRNYRPEIIFISAGFDAHRDDPLGSLRLTTEYFGEMTKILRNISVEFSSGRVVSVLEGGYNPGALRDSVSAHLEKLCS